jgi:16S rRNA (guanine966-N2)-methyltransferase
MRITGGAHRSRSLVAPRGQATRPTSDRVREALFAILGAASPIEGARVLDLYAGTGALALEALSRGASCAVLVERAKDALEAIRANVSALGVSAAARVVASPVERAARVIEKGSEAPFDLVFADPPYADVASGAATRAIASIVAAGLVASGARVVLEHGKNDDAPAIAGLVHEDTRRYGDTSLSFYVAHVVPLAPVAPASATS